MRHYMTRTIYLFSITLIAAMFLPFFNSPAAAQDRIFEIGAFSANQPGQDIPKDWKPFLFKNITHHTRYSLVKDNGVTVVKAVSDNAASGLIRKMTIDPEKYPIIEWRWKVSNVYSKGDVTQKSGDDFPARLYIAFQEKSDKMSLWEKAVDKTIKIIYGITPPTDAITYIWANKAPVGSITANPFTDRVRMIAVESGSAKENTWVTEKRNIYKDYIKCFGQPPPMISGIAIMTDSDNTHESAVAYYGDIIMKSGD